MEAPRTEPVSPFHDIFLPEIWAQILVFAGYGNRHATHDRVTPAMIALTCRAEFQRMRAEKRKIIHRPDGKVWVTEMDWFLPQYWFDNAAGDGYESICLWLWEEFRYARKHMFFDSALVRGHFALATVLDNLRVPMTPGIQQDLVLNNNLDALKWLVARGYPLKDYLLVDATHDWMLPMIRWLVEEQHQDPVEYGSVRGALMHDAFETAAYLADHGATLYDCTQMALAGAWDALDFVKARFPDLYASECKRYPLIAVRHDARPHVGWRSHANLDDPDGPDVVSDHEEED